MLAEEGAVALTGAAARVALQHRRAVHSYFVAFVAVFAALVLAGFSRRFFLPVFQGSFAKPLLIHIHAAVFFGWLVLLITQTGLAASRKLRWHRAVGQYGAWLIAPMLVTGTIVSARDSRHDYLTGDGEAALSFFYGELADLVMFGALASIAMLLKSKPEFHKRLVLLGSLGLLGAAVGRIQEQNGTYTWIFLGLIASIGAYDFASVRRLHPATLAGGSFLVVVNFSEEAIGSTRAWIDVAHRLLSV